VSINLKATENAFIQTLVDVLHNTLNRAKSLHVNIEKILEPRSVWAAKEKEGNRNRNYTECGIIRFKESKLFFKFTSYSLELKWYYGSWSKDYGDQWDYSTELGWHQFAGYNHYHAYAATAIMEDYDEFMSWFNSAVADITAACDQKSEEVSSSVSKMQQFIDFMKPAEV
jgi:hypothetical protein